jgi:glycosyltransferase A (GT-A) superfamily protein (DUF2064 family)
VTAKRGLWFVVLLMALILVAYTVWRLREVASVATASPALSASSKHQTEATENQHLHAHGDPRMQAMLQAWPKDEQYDAIKHRFDSPGLLNEVLFDASTTALQSEAACKTNEAISGANAAEQQIKQLYALSSEERFPEEIFFRTLTQFWRLGDEYYQLSAVWDIGIPPVYRIKFFTSPTPDFSRDVIEVTPPLAVPAVLDSAASAQYVAALTAQYQQQGAQLGQRILEMEMPSDQEGERVEIKLADAQPLSWTFPGGACLLNNSGKAMQCRCVQADTELNARKERPRTS